MTCPTTPADREARQAIAEQIREDLVSGKRTWSECVRLSNCRAQTGGGRLGGLPRYRRYNDAFMEQVWELPEGQISEVIESPLGFHIAEVLRRGKGRLTFDDPRTQREIRRVLEDRPLSEAMAQLVAANPIVGVNAPDLSRILPPASAPATQPATQPS